MAKSAAELQADWWDGWWKQDFSWAGLAEKPVGWNGDVIHGGTHGEPDLQAWWRRDPETEATRDDAALRAAGELLTGPDGREWHIAHVPLYWPDRTPAKAGWAEDARDRLAAVISQRLAVASEPVTDDLCRATAPDSRAQLSGAIFLLAPAHPNGPIPALHAVCDWSLFPGRWEKGTPLGAGFSSENANFSGEAIFHSATFFGAASFRSATFCGYASFDRAIFSGYARFNNATFYGYASFDSATFRKRAGFKNVTFYGDANFTGATFSGETYFDMAHFSGYASFLSATFSGDARFRSARFSDASFIRATFSGSATFDWGEFASHVSFLGARFISAGRAAPIGFRSWRFSGIAEFDYAQLERRVEFTASVFAGLASFQNITWPQDTTDAQGMFSQAVFKDLASLQGAGLRCFAAFDGAVLQGGLQLDDADEVTANATFRRERWQAEALPDREDALRQLEGGCRVLKQAMERSANKAREQMFYAFELMARRHQRATPWWERQISRAYGAVADYGRSIGRPLLWLALLVPAFAAAYAGLLYGWRGEALAGLAPRVVLVECLSHSAQRVLPFGPWALTPAQIAQSPVQSQLQGPTDALLSLAIRGLGSLQSLLALILAFLAGLAIRRRFQIN